MIALAVGIAALSFLVSASAGLGGSLLLVPALSILFGVKHGVALAAVLLGCNNVAKVVVYRDSIPWREALGVTLMTLVGTSIGAGLLIAAPEFWVEVAVIASIVSTIALERAIQPSSRRISASVLAFASGATSGFSGTSGPLKGAALRNLALDRFHFVGAASVVSLVADVTKAAIFWQASLIDAAVLPVVFWSLPLMPLTALAARRINRRIGERAYSGLFWTVMAGYTLRLALT